jgi:hypothetical protein
LTARNVDPVLDCLAAQVKRAWSGPGGTDVKQLGPDPLKVTSRAMRTEARAYQLGASGSSYFLDMLLMEQGPAVVLALFIHTGEILPADESRTVDLLLHRLAER